MSSQSDDSGPPRKLWADLGTRLVSAVFLLVVAVAAVVLGGPWFALVTGCAFAGAYREWEIMVTGKPVTILGYALMAALVFAGLVFTLWGLNAALIVMMLAGLAALVFPSPARGWRVAGFLYLCLVVLALSTIRDSETLGISAAVFLGAAVWLTDSGAFFTGRQVGGAKLSPEISPSKTWSGAVGGLAAGAIGATVVWVVATPSPVWIGFGIALLLSVSGQLGDLAESAIKRRFKIKDSSDLIPGHGGLLDRLDSLTSATLVLYLIGVARGGIEAIPSGALLW